MEEILALIKSYEKLYYQWSKRSGMSETAFFILLTVWEKKGSCSQADVCDYWSYSRQTVNSAIKQLEEEGYVLRVQQDVGRKKRIALTERGECYATTHIAPLLCLDDELWTQIPPGERNTCIGVIRTHLDAFASRLEAFQVSGNESE